MKSNIRFMMVMTLGLFLIGCGNRNAKKQAADMHSSELSLDWQGTYAGIIANGEEAGLYQMIAIDSAEFERASKQIDMAGIQIDKGNFICKNDTITIDEIPYHLAENMLVHDTDTLFKLNDRTQLPQALLQESLIASGKNTQNALLKRYTSEGKTVAELNFAGKNYRLPLDENDTQTNQYSDGTNRLEMEVIDPAPMPLTTPVFSDGKNRYEFTIANPISCSYTSADAPAIEAIYCNDADEKFVLLISDHSRGCYFLAQTEASAKGATYSDGTITWESSNESATITMGDKKRTYKAKR